MKTYKTWEAIKILTENPSLEFIRADVHTEDTNYLKLSVDTVNTPTYTGKKLRYRNKWDSNQDFSDALNAIWTLVKQPVDFMTAIKAYDEGKTIICERSNLPKTIYKKNQITLKDQYDRAISTYEILKGKWYIEE